jgi:hypothetical protein
MVTKDCNNYIEMAIFLRNFESFVKISALKHKRFQ